MRTRALGRSGLQVSEVSLGSWLTLGTRVDGAHNPDGAEAAVDTLESGFSVGGRRILVTGMMGEKDAGWMLESLGAGDADLVICTEAATPRAMPAEQLGAVADDEGYDVEIVPDPADAMARALAIADEEDVIFGAGSLYVVGNLRDAWIELQTDT